jgi:hypothetical protein
MAFVIPPPSTVDVLAEQDPPTNPNSEIDLRIEGLGGSNTIVSSS